MAVRRVVITGVDDSGKAQLIQSQHADGRVSEDVEHAQPYGLRFVPVVGVDGLVSLPGGVMSACVLTGVIDRDNQPVGGSAPGTGGLYQGGLYRVFLADDGTLVLCGESDGGREAADAVAVASKVMTELERVKSELDALKSVFDAHTHPYVDTPVGAAVTAPSATPWAPGPAAPGEVASTKVKIPEG